MGNIIQTIKVVQGEHSFQVTAADILKYPNSFLALHMNFNEEPQQKTIRLKNRNVACFPQVKKFYESGGKVKLPNYIDINTAREELSFWFPGETIDIVYKDILYNFAYNQKLKVESFLEQERDKLQHDLLDCANNGKLECIKLLRYSWVDDSSFALREYKNMYERLVRELFPSDKWQVAFECPMKKSDDLKLVLRWELKYTAGVLGALTAARSKEKCQQLLNAMLNVGMENCFKGKCNVKLSDVFGSEQLPQHFEKFFKEYISRKSSQKFNVAFECTKGIFCWDFSDIVKTL